MLSEVPLARSSARGALNYLRSAFTEYRDSLNEREAPVLRRRLITDAHFRACVIAGMVHKAAIVSAVSSLSDDEHCRAVL